MAGRLVNSLVMMVAATALLATACSPVSSPTSSTSSPAIASSTTTRPASESTSATSVATGGGEGISAGQLSSAELSDHHVASFLRSLRFFYVLRSGWTDHTPEELIDGIQQWRRRGTPVVVEAFDDVVLSFEDLEQNQHRQTGGNVLATYVSGFGDSSTPGSVSSGMATWRDPGLSQKRVSGLWIDEGLGVRYVFNTLIRPDGTEGIYVAETSVLMNSEGFDVSPMFVSDVEGPLCDELDRAPAGISPEQLVSTLPSQHASIYHSPVEGIRQIVFGFATCGGGTALGMGVAHVLAYHEILAAQRQQREWAISLFAVLNDCAELEREYDLYDREAANWLAAGEPERAALQEQWRDAAGARLEELGCDR